MPEIGDILGGKFRLSRLLGQGGMGAVYEASHVVLGKVFAIKLLHSRYVMNPEVFARFQLEAQAAASIGHRGIVDVYDIGQTDDGVPYLVMELLHGESLAELLDRERQLDVTVAVEITAQVLTALVAVHGKQIVHRDLKPENVFLAEDDDLTWRAKILDFGISKVAQPDAIQLTATGSVLGTAHYMSPEHARGAKDVDRRADIWAAGAILYRALTGRHPFEGDSYNEVLAKILTEPVTPPRSARPEIPGDLEKVVLKAMAKDRDERYASATDLLDELGPFRAEPGQAPSPWSTPAKPDAEDSTATKVPDAVRPGGPSPADGEDLKPTEAFEVEPESSTEDRDKVEWQTTTPAPPAKGPAAGNAVAHDEPRSFPETSVLPTSPWRHATPPWQVAPPGQPDTFDVGMKDAPRRSPRTRLLVALVLGASFVVLAGAGVIAFMMPGEPSPIVDTREAPFGAPDEATDPAPPPSEPPPQLATTAAATSTSTASPEAGAHQGDQTIEETPESPSKSTASADPATFAGREESAEVRRAQATPRRLTAEEIDAALRPLRPRLKRCVESVRPVPSLVRVKIGIGSSGTARYEGALPSPPASVAGCLRETVSGTRVSSSRVEPATRWISISGAPRHEPSKQQSPLWSSPFE